MKWRVFRFITTFADHVRPPIAEPDPQPSATTGFGFVRSLHRRIRIGGRRRVGDGGRAREIVRGWPVVGGNVKTRCGDWFGETRSGRRDVRRRRTSTSSAQEGFDLRFRGALVLVLGEQFLSPMRLPDGLAALCSHIGDGIIDRHALRVSTAGS